MPTYPLAVVDATFPKKITENLDEILMVKKFYSHDQSTNQMNIKAGMTVGKHVHEYNHLSILASGEVMVRVGTKETKLIAPAVIEIEAYEPHTIFAIKDSIWYCIHNTINEGL